MYEIVPEIMKEEEEVRLVKSSDGTRLYLEWLYEGHDWKPVAHAEYSVSTHIWTVKWWELNRHAKEPASFQEQTKTSSMNDAANALWEVRARVTDK